MSRMIVNTKLPFDNGSHAPGGPDITAKAKCLGSTCQQRWKLCSLGQGQFGFRARSQMATQGIITLHLCPFDPLTNGTWRDTESGGDVALFPALLEQFPCSESTTFLPIARFGSNWFFHANASCISRTNFRNLCIDQ